MAAARADNPENVDLLKVAAAMGLEPGGVAVDEGRRDEALASVTQNLERMVDPDRGIADLGRFAARIQELLRQVCAVETGNGFGTGFLIGPQTVLTNYHVVEKVIKGDVSPSVVRVRFDFRRLRDGLTTIAGTAYELADEWLVHAEPYSAADQKAYDPAILPGDHELDYAVLRTRDPIGTQPSTGAGADTPGLGRPAGSPVRVRRGRVPDGRPAPVPRPDLVRRPRRRRPAAQPNGTRVHYRNNTMPGSSGSPVLDRDLDLVALHHAGEPGSPDWKPAVQGAADAGGLQRGDPDRADPG